MPSTVASTTSPLCIHSCGFLPAPTPAGVPVATVGVGNAKNAGLLAARILGVSDEGVSKKVSEELAKLNTEAKVKGANLTAKRSQKTGF